MAVEYLTKKSTGWFRGCGCGQKQGDLVTPPANSVDLVIPRAGELIGPVTGIKYNIVPQTVSIDIDSQDAAIWKSQHIARDPVPGLKGVATRVQ